MKRYLVLLTLLVGVLPVFTASAADASGVCPPNPPPGSTVYGNLTVPNNQLCTLQDVTVYGSVTVNPGAQLNMLGGQINGSLTDNGGSVAITTSSQSAPRISGAVLADNPIAAGFCDPVFGSSLTVRNWVAHGSTLAPSMNFFNNHVHVFWSGLQVSGSFNASGNTGGGAFDHMTIGGAAACNNNNPAYTFATTTVTGTNSCF